MVSIKLLGDLILVKPEDFRSDFLILPPSDVLRADRPGDYEDMFTGRVVATGPGDKMVVGRCRQCQAEKKLMLDRRKKGFGACVCGAHDFNLHRVEHVATECKVGDRIIFPRRPTAPGGDNNVDLGEGYHRDEYMLFHEEQFAYAIISEDVRLGLSGTRPSDAITPSQVHDGLSTD